MLPVLSLWRILTTGWGRFSSNAVIKEHDVGEQIASAGPGLMWKVFFVIICSIHDNVLTGHSARPDSQRHVPFATQASGRVDF